MFCPKCATQNVEGASYCRKCGANISMVPQALTGQPRMANPPDDQYYGRRRRPSMDRAIRSLTMGVAFAVMIALTSKLSPGSARWWFWLLIPAMILFGRGFAEVARVLRTKNQLQTTSQPQLNSARPFDFPVHQTTELEAVPSVTENTTRHLENEVRTRQLDSVEGRRIR